MLVSDALGSVPSIVDSSGAVTASKAHDAWGNPQTFSDTVLPEPL